VELHLIRYDMIYLLTAIMLTPGGSNTIQVYTNTIYRTTQLISFPITDLGRTWGFQQSVAPRFF